MTATALGGFGIAGTGDSEATVEREILWGSDNARLIAVRKSAIISGVTRDATNTPTTVLRPGLVLGLITASGKYKEYDPASTDGSQYASAILQIETRAQDFNANNADRCFGVYVSGIVRASRLIGLDGSARNHLAKQFLFDDDLMGEFVPFPRQKVVTANTTVTAAMNGTWFIVAGGAGVTFTLPTLAAGLRYKFTNRDNANMVITSAAGNDIVTVNDDQASSLTFSTANEKIGATAELYTNAAATRWLSVLGAGNTVTIA